MSNDVKWIDWRSSELNGPQSSLAVTSPRTAMLQLLGCVLGLAALAAVLPGPGSWASLLSAVTTGTPGPEPIGAAAEAAILVAAAILVWALLAWVLVVWFAAVAGRLPGAPGRCGRLLLRTIAPAASGRLIAAAVGVSLLAGTSACAVPAMADLGSGSAAGGTAGTSIASTTPVPTGGGTGVAESAPTSVAPASVPPASEPPASVPPTAPMTGATSPDGAIGSITIDWPAAAAPATGPTATPAPTSTPTPAATTPADTAPTEVTAESSAELPAPPAPETPAKPDGTSAAHQPDPATPAADPTIPSSPATGTPPAGTTAEPASSPPASPGASPAGTSTPTPAHSVAPEATNPDSTNSDSTLPGSTTPDAGDDQLDAVEVLAGDTLWSIAHHHLTADATDEEVDTAWRAWYSANTQVIGAEPDLIQPGQLLLPPDPEMGR